MSWNYRIVEDKYGGLSIHEVYYDDQTGVIDGWSEKGVAPFGETLQELNSDFRMMQDALYHNVLRETPSGLVEHPAYTKRTEVHHDSTD